MARKKTTEPAAAPADDAAVPRQWRVQLSKGYRHGRTWLRPGARRVLVSEAVLADMQAAGVVAAAEEA